MDLSFFLLHRETLISQSFKKISVTQSPCTLLVSTNFEVDELCKSQNNNKFPNVVLQNNCTPQRWWWATENWRRSTNKESAQWPSHRFFLNFVKLKFPYVVKKMTNPYDPLFRNTQEDICRFSYSLFCAVFYKVCCGQVVIGIVFLVVTSMVQISQLVFFFL